MTKVFARPTIKSAEDYAKDMEKSLGGNDESATVTHFIDTGLPSFNKIMTGRFDGGVPCARLVEVYGGSSSGKTALASDWMASAQQQGGVAGFRDWERSFSQVVASEGYGVDLTPPYWSYKKPRTWEEGNTQAAEYAQWIREKGVIHEEAPIVIVLDSIAAAVPNSAAGKKFDEMTMHDSLALAKIAGTTLKAMAIAAEDYNATFIYLNQIREKPGVMFGDPTTTPGGKAMEFYATVRLFLSREKVMAQVDGEKEFIGQNINIKCVKSKITKPFSTTSARLSFNDAGVAFFDKELSMIEDLIALGKLEKPANGFVMWDGKRYGQKVLAKQLREEKRRDELVACYFK